MRRALEAVGLAVNRLIRVSYGPFQLGDLEPGAVEEVRPKVLREQLGRRSPSRDPAVAARASAACSGYARRERCNAAGAGRQRPGASAGRAQRDNAERAYWRAPLSDAAQNPRTRFTWRPAGRLQTRPVAADAST